jgi:iron complex outermembrane recepter protein
MFVRVGVSNQFDEVCEQLLSPGIDRGNIKNNLTKEQVRAMKLNTRVNANSQIFSPVFLKTRFLKSNLSRAIAVTTAISGGAISAVMSSAAMADETFSLEEIIVTAQKREQNLQEVPVAVTAFDAQALENGGIQNITELQKSAPNVTMQVSRGTNTTLTSYIRGIGQADPLWGFEPGVGLYVDDIYLARPQAGVLDVYDVERIEVLRGPQGTLYGKNTIGGAIKYVTKRLTGEPEFSFDVGVGSYNQRDTKISGQLPLIEDKLYVGGSIAKFTRDGFGEFLLNGDENYNKDVMAARVSLEYLPTDDISIRISADKTDDDSNAKGGHRLTQSLLVPTEPVPSDIYDSYSDMSTDNEVKSSGGSMIVTWDIDEQYTLKSITSYREGESDTNIDFDNTSFASLHVPALYEDDQITQEFQLTYAGDNLDIVGGIYYYEGTAAGSFDVALGAFDNPDVHGDGSNVVGNFVAVTSGEVDTQSYAAYLQASFHIAEDLTMTLGGRYTVDKKDAEVYKESLYANGKSSLLGGEDYLSLAVKTDYSNNESWSQFSPKVGLDYVINDDVMAYASFSQGFKSGGFDMRGDASELPSTVDGYDPELVDTWELGVKAELFDNRVRLNAAVFYTDYTDMQVTTQSANAAGNNYVSAVLNAGEATVQGFEIEALAQVTENLTATLMVGYIDAEYNEVETETAGGIVDVSDDWSFANTPEKVAQLGLNYVHDFGDMGEINFSTNVSFRDETQIFPQTESLIDEDSYTLWDASAVWYSADEHWKVGLHAKNITDEEYRVAGYNFIGLGAEDSIIGYYGDPRIVTLNLGYNF